MPYCQHCGDYFDEMKVKTQHVRNCIQNPKVIKALDEKHHQSEAEVNLREMRSRIFTYDDIFNEVDKFLDDKGYYVEWTDRPSKFNTAIKTDYFTQPDINRNEEKIYVGWTGRFAGQLYNKDGTRASISFWDLTGNMNGVYNIGFLKSGSGSWSSGFSGNGIIFVEDFPNMFKEYHNIGFNERYNILIQQQVDDILSKLMNDEHAAINNDETLQELDQRLKEARALENNIIKVRAIHQGYVKKKFQSEIVIDLPVLEIPFVDTDNYNTFQSTYKKPLKGVAPTVDISEFKDKLNDIKSKAEKYTNQYVEYFI